MSTALLLVAMIGQTGAPSGPPQNYVLRCPMGDQIVIRGWRQGNHVFVRAEPGAGPLVISCPRGHETVIRGRSVPNGLLVNLRAAPQVNYGVDHGHFPALAPGKSWYGGNVDFRPSVGAPGEKPNRVHLTIIGSQVEREAARKDLEQSPGFQRLAEEMGDNLAVQDYGPENPLVAEVGLVDGGKPDIVIQRTAGGKVTYRAHEYPGADVITNEIRRADPRYSPKNDPGGSAPFSPWNIGLSDNPARDCAVGAVVGLLGVILLRKSGAVQS